jgi:type IV secretory pathway TrbD component
MKSWRKTRRSAQERAKRIRILNAELDVLRGASSERSRTIDTKASFVVVVAGVLASVTGLSLVTLDTWLVGLLPFGLTVAAVAVATAALWPRKIDLPSAREVVDAWVDADMPADELEDNVLEVKAQEVTNRDWGFGLVLAGLVTTLAGVTLNALSPTWSSHDEAEPTQTPVSTQAPATP